jgi:diguanylate cyclase (GGDEF)-like protein
VTRQIASPDFAAQLRRAVRRLPRGEALPESQWAVRHRAILCLLWLQSACLVVACLVWQPPAQAVASSTALALLTLVATVRTFPRQWRSVAAALGLLTGSAVLVALTGGVTESLFHFLVMLAVIAVYQEWLPFLVALAFTLIHHAALGIWAPHAVFSTPFALRHPLAWTTVHVGFVLVASAANLFAWRIAEDQRGLSEQVLSSGDGVFGVDAHGRIRFINEAAMRLLGARNTHIAKDAALGRDHHQVFGHADEHGTYYLPDECPACTVIQVAGGDLVSGWSFTRLDTGASFPVEYIATPRSGGGAVVSFRDVSERVAMQAELTRIALQDPATGLPNRACMQDRIDSAVSRLARRPEPLAVLFCDLDRFKEINDQYGHAAGDELLRQVAQRLESTVRGVDTVARFAGDEFVMLCEGLSSDAEVGLIAERVLAEFARPFDLGGTSVRVGCSVGAATSDDPTVTTDDLLRRADAAMYRAKMRGRGQWQQFDPALGRPLVNRPAHIELDEAELHPVMPDTSTG